MGRGAQGQTQSCSHFLSETEALVPGSWGHSVLVEFSQMHVPRLPGTTQSPTTPHGGPALRAGREVCALRMCRSQLRDPAHKWPSHRSTSGGHTRTPGRAQTLAPMPPSHAPPQPPPSRLLSQETSYHRLPRVQTPSLGKGLERAALGRDFPWAWLRDLRLNLQPALLPLPARPGPALEGVGSRQSGRELKVALLLVSCC